MKSVLYNKNTEIPTTAKRSTNKCSYIERYMNTFFRDLGYLHMDGVLQNPILGQADALETTVGPQWGTGASDSAHETKQSEKAPPI